jgi:hypothetical protein
MATNRPRTHLVPRQPDLGMLLEGPAQFVIFARQFSTLCPEHGTDYKAALPGYEPPISPRTLPDVELHRILGPNATAEQLAACCRSAVRDWRVSKESPRERCCRSAVELYKRREDSAKAQKKKTESDLDPCCKSALRAYRWWQVLEHEGNIKLTALQRLSIVRALHWVSHGVVRKDDLDQFIKVIAQIYVQAGSKITGFVRHGGDAHSPLAKLLAYLRSVLPEPLRCRDLRDRDTGDVYVTPTNLLRHARQVVHGKRDWHPEDGGNLRLIEWDCGHGDTLRLRVVEPQGLRDDQRMRFTLRDRKIGEEFAVPANWNYERPRRLEPVDLYWKKRLAEGAVSIVGPAPKPRKKQKKPLSPA